MLSSEFSFCFEPVEECVFGEDVDDGFAQGKVIVALGFVVGVEGLEGVVEDFGKKLERHGRALEFNEPLMRPVCVFGNVDGRHGVVAHKGIGFFAGNLQGVLGIIHNDFFAKGIDVMLGAPGDFNAEGREAGELDGVANEVAPQATIG